MFCTNCGTQLADDCVFCTNCGTKLSAPAAPVAPVQPPMGQAPMPNGLIYSIDGVRGRHIDVYDNKAVITVKPTFGSFLTNNLTDGEKTIYYSDCVGVQFKKSGMTIGYLQLETASSMMNNRNSNFFGENSFTFDAKHPSNEFMEQVAAYIRGRIEEIKANKDRPTVVNSVSAADEIRKLKELLDLGIISQEEFDAKKKQLLGI